MSYERPDFLKHTVPDHWYPTKEIPEVLGFKENLKGIEIGASHGGSTHHLLENLPNSHITAIDPYIAYDQMQDTSRAYENFQRLMEMYPERITLIRETSDEAASKIEDESMDFIFIDGYHSNEQVTKDIENYYPKLKEGGLLCGHDYQAWGLSESVNAKALEYDKTVSFCEQDCWYWRK